MSPVITMPIYAITIVLLGTGYSQAQNLTPTEQAQQGVLAARKSFEELQEKGGDTDPFVALDKCIAKGRPALQPSPQATAVMVQSCIDQAGPLTLSPDYIRHNILAMIDDPEEQGRPMRFRPWQIARKYNTDCRFDLLNTLGAFVKNPIGVKNCETTRDVVSANIMRANQPMIDATKAQLVLETLMGQK